MSGDKLKQVFRQLNIEHVVYSLNWTGTGQSERVLTERFRSGDPAACVVFINSEIHNHTELTVLTVYS